MVMPKVIHRSAVMLRVMCRSAVMLRVTQWVIGDSQNHRSAVMLRVTHVSGDAQGHSVGQW